MYISSHSRKPIHIRLLISGFIILKSLNKSILKEFIIDAYKSSNLLQLIIAEIKRKNNNSTLPFKLLLKL
jgi:hypothetical protein